MTEDNSVPLFLHLKAWFSISVPLIRKKVWVEHGGEISDIDEAMLIFSQEIDSPDTKELYESEAYLKDHLAVFHSSYIEACVRCGNKKDVVLGDYFMPSKEVYDAIKSKVKFVWDDDTISTSPQQTNHKQARKTSRTQKAPQRYRNTNQYKDYTHINTLQQVQGEIMPFVVWENSCSVEFKAKRRRQEQLE